MHAEDAGNPDGEPIVLLHGFMSCNAQWDLNREALGEHLALVMVEMMGHGNSAAPDDPDAYTPEVVVAELERIRTERGIERWWVCGQSLGGALALRYTVEHPDRVKGLIFTNSRAVFGLPRTGVSEDGGQRPPRPQSVRDLPIHPINAKRFPEAVKARMVAAADAMPMHVIHHVTAHRHAWSGVDRLGELTMPVLLVNGLWEKAFQPSVPKAREHITNLRVVDLEGGHSINVEQAQQFNEAVLAFVGVSALDS